MDVERGVRKARLRVAIAFGLSLTILSGLLLLSRDPQRREVLSCGMGPPFPPSTLGASKPPEPRDRRARTALREALARPRGYGHTGTDPWRVLSQDDDEVLWATGSGDVLTVLLVRKGWGGWSSSSYGGCRPRPYRPGKENGSWKLFPGVVPQQNSKELDVLVEGHQCASGLSFGPRINRPEIDYGSDRVVVTFFLDEPPGKSHTCQGIPPHPYRLRLGQPLGPAGSWTAVSIRRRSVLRKVRALPRKTERRASGSSASPVRDEETTRASRWKPSANTSPLTSPPEAAWRSGRGSSRCGPIWNREMKNAPDRDHARSPRPASSEKTWARSTDPGRKEALTLGRGPDA